MRRLRLQAQRLTDKLSEQEKEKIIRWLKDYTELTKLSTLTLPAQRIRIRDSLASDDTIRTFVLELSVAFYACGGLTDDFEERLVNSLAEGLRFDGRDRDMSELPQELLATGPLVNFPATVPTLRLRLSTLALRVLRALRLVKDPSFEVSLNEYLLSNRLLQLVMMLALADDLVTPSQE